MKTWNRACVLIVIMLPLILIVSCKKDNKGSLLSTNASDWIDLQVGNYWIYDRIEVNYVGDTTVTIAADSVYVRHDTVIGSNLYYYVAGWYSPGSIAGSYLRDSAEYLIDIHGYILFSAVPDNHTFYSWSGVPCSIDGTLTTNEYSMSWYTSEAVVGVNRPILTRSHYMDCVPFNGITQPMTLPTKFALGVGMVEQYLVFQSVFYSGGSNRLGRKLRRYHIQ